MAAWGDSFRVKVDEPSYIDFSDVASRGSSKEKVAAPSTRTQSAASTPLAPILTGPQDFAVAVAKPEKPREEKPREEEAPKIRSIQEGAALSLVTSERVCTSRVGDTFRATLVAPVSTNGGTIPSGSRAVAEITSNDQWGAGIGVRIRSIHTGGATYPVNSGVTYIMPESGDDGTCIPRRAHIDTEAKG